MRVESDILDTDGERIATAVWSGRTPSDPGGELTYQDIAREDRFEQFLGMIAMRGDLGALRFRSAFGVGWVDGWSGVEGNLGALRLVVPALGMTIGSPRVLP
jgi:hypothetical protein